MLHLSSHLSIHSISKWLTISFPTFSTAKYIRDKNAGTEMWGWTVTPCFMTTYRWNCLWSGLMIKNFLSTYTFVFSSKWRRRTTSVSLSQDWQRNYPYDNKRDIIVQLTDVERGWELKRKDSMQMRNSILEISIETSQLASINPKWGFQLRYLCLKLQIPIAIGERG